MSRKSGIRACSAKALRTFIRSQVGKGPLLFSTCLSFDQCLPDSSAMGNFWRLFIYQQRGAQSRQMILAFNEDQHYQGFATALA